MELYESLFIIRSSVSDEETAALIEKIIVEHVGVAEYGNSSELVSSLECDFAGNWHRPRDVILSGKRRDSRLTNVVGRGRKPVS